MVAFSDQCIKATGSVWERCDLPHHTVSPDECDHSTRKRQTQRVAALGGKRPVGGASGSRLGAGSRIALVRAATAVLALVPLDRLRFLNKRQK